MNKKVNSLILDPDIEMAGKFKQVILPIFPDTRIQNNPSLFEDDVKQFVADVVFLNLNITHRDASFQLIERLSGSTRPPLFYCYLDSSTPEVVAHAIENGAQDVFTRPFDQALIATKLSEHIKNERTQEDQLQMKALVPSVPASVTFSFNLISVDENGLTMQGKHYISKGTRIDFNAPIIQEIFGKESLPMMFSKTSKCEHEQGYNFYLEPVNPNETHAAALRSFIIRKKQL